MSVKKTVLSLTMQPMHRHLINDPNNGYEEIGKVSPTTESTSALKIHQKVNTAEVKRQEIATTRKLRDFSISEKRKSKTKNNMPKNTNRKVI